MPNVIISGGSRGIGLLLVRGFAAAGYNVATCSRKKAELDTLKAELEATYPGQKFLAFQADMAVKQEAQAFGQTALETLGAPDIVINNTGIFIPGTFLDEEDGVFETQINTNLASAYHLTRTLLPALTKLKRGYIFNICSIASITAYPNGGSYTISKFGLLGFSKVLREELKPYNIRVTSVLPGATKTSSWDGTDLPDHRFIDPKDLADLILYLSNTPFSMMVEEILVRPFPGDID